MEPSATSTAVVAPAARSRAPTASSSSTTLTSFLEKKNLVSQPASKTCICYASSSLESIGRERSQEAKRRVYIRYGFMFVHTGFTFASLAFALYRRDPILSGMVGGMALAYLIYVPAAFALCLLKKATRFDHVAGEMAYLSVQLAGYLGAGLYPAIMLSFEDCSFVWDRYDWGNHKFVGSSDSSDWCGMLRKSVALGFTHAGILALWLLWLMGVTVRIGLRKRGGPGVGRAMQVSTGWLLSGWPVSAGERARPY